MELRHLRYFVAVADEQHVGRAASRLHVSPSPLSRQLRELEREVGVPLLERVGRGIRTSPAGVLFAERVRGILAEVDRAVGEAQAASRGEAGHLAIGFVESGALAKLIPAVVGALRRRHPGVTLELVPLGNDEVREALSARRVTAVLAFGLMDPERAFRSQLLFTRRVELALPRQHPLARRRRLYLRDLHDQPFVWSTRWERAPFLDSMWAVLRSHGVTPRVVLESRSTMTRLSLVASGVGMTFVAHAAARPAQVVIKVVTDLTLEAKGYLAWRSEDEGAPLVRSLREMTREATREATG
jgi:DNA-binding transcriptional LysR family regulator